MFVGGSSGGSSCLFLSRGAVSPSFMKVRHKAPPMKGRKSPAESQSDEGNGRLAWGSSKISIPDCGVAHEKVLLSREHAHSQRVEISFLVALASVTAFCPTKPLLVHEYLSLDVQRNY